MKQRSFQKPKKQSHSKDFRQNKPVIVKKTIKAPLLTSVIENRKSVKPNIDLKKLTEEYKEKRSTQKCAKLKIHYA